MNTYSRKIDVHHHFLPPEFMADLKRRGISWTGGPPMPDWNVSKGREAMARMGIDIAVASVVPHVHWGDDAAAKHWARHSNEFTARIVHDDPQHFGGFATLPLPDVKASLEELAYALDVLKLDGVSLMSSYDNRYLGDPAFEELFRELDRRKAVVHIHPTVVPPGSIVPKLSIPWGLVEFVFDTTRAVTNLIYSGTLERYPSIRFIVSHGGGAVPYLAGRLALGQDIPGYPDKAPKGVMHYLKRLYYDTALSTTESAFAAMRELVPTSQILFGSDYPMVAEPIVTRNIKEFETSRVLDDTARRAIERDNALALFPRFASPGATTGATVARAAKVR